MPRAVIIPEVETLLTASLAQREREAKGPWCLYRLNKWGVRTIPLRDRSERRLRHEKIGIEYGQCGHLATHLIDKEPMCERHAGMRALAILLESGS